VERNRDYFDWSARVVAGLRGIHPELEAVFDALLARVAELTKPVKWSRPGMSLPRV